MRLKDYPRQLTIGTAIWDVRFQRTLDHKPSKYIKWGECDPINQVIYIRLGQSAEQRLTTFIHEVLHAIEAEYKVEIAHDLVNALEKPLARLLIDNGIVG